MQHVSKQKVKNIITVLEVAKSVKGSDWGWSEEIREGGGSFRQSLHLKAFSFSVFLGSGNVNVHLSSFSGVKLICSL